jgi:hypothetical protein
MPSAKSLELQLEELIVSGRLDQSDVLKARLLMTMLHNEQDLKDRLWGHFLDISLVRKDKDIVHNLAMITNTPTRIESLDLNAPPWNVEDVDPRKM